MAPGAKPMQQELRTEAAKSKDSAQLTPVPVVDISLLRQPSPSRPLLIEEIGRACRQGGYFQVVNHGIEGRLMQAALDVASDFFNLPEEQKVGLMSNNISMPVRFENGVQNGGGEKVNFQRVFLKHYAHPIGQWIGLWPHEPADYREKIGKYTVEVRRVALQLIEAILESLGLNPCYINDKFRSCVQMMAVHGYPPCRREELSLGLPPHTDYSCITIILQNHEGLQVVDPRTDDWLAVPAPPGVLHVHVGDHMEVLSNGRYKSTVHRVVLGCDRKRLSVASFHGLGMDEKMAPAPALVDEQHERRYRESSFRDFLEHVSTNKFTRGRSFLDTLRIAKP